MCSVVALFSSYILLLTTACELHRFRLPEIHLSGPAQSCCHSTDRVSTHLGLTAVSVLGFTSGGRPSPTHPSLGWSPSFPPLRVVHLAKCRQVTTLILYHTGYGVSTQDCVYFLYGSLTVAAPPGVGRLSGQVRLLLVPARPAWYNLNCSSAGSPSTVGFCETGHATGVGSERRPA